MWFIQMGKGSNGWFVVCMGNGVENRFVVVHGKSNGWWELRSSMKQDEIGDMGCEKRGLLRANAPFSKSCLLLHGNLKSTKLNT